MAVLALAAIMAWLAALWMRERWLLAAAVTLTLAGGGLAYAAHDYRQGIPAKRAADTALLQADPARAAAAFVARHEAARTWPHFLRLSLIWGAVSAAAVLGMIVLRSPPIRGVGLALVLLCAVTWILDLAAYRRDVAYAAAWEALQPQEARQR